LAKAIIRFPGGTKNRWERISEQLNGTKSIDSIIDKVKNATKVKQSPTTKLAQQYNQNKGGSNGIVIKIEADQATTEWESTEQAALEEALKKYPASLGVSRWDSIAEEIPGRSKKECVMRYKYLVEIIRQSRSEQQ